MFFLYLYRNRATPIQHLECVLVTRIEGERAENGERAISSRRPKPRVQVQVQRRDRGRGSRVISDIKHEIACRIVRKSHRRNPSALP